MSSETYALNVDTGRETYTANRPTKTVYSRGERGEDVEGGPLWSPVRAFYLNGIGPCDCQTFYDPTAKTQGGHSMLEEHDSTNQFEVHDPAILAQARAILDACSSPQEMQEAVLAAVTRNEEWRGKRCLNLLAPEAPTSPAVRALLSAEVGTRAAEGHIGPVNRWFAGTRHIDEIEALCVELLKKAFRARYADHRLVASMLGNLAVYTALTEPGDVIMSITQPSEVIPATVSTDRQEYAV